eukprot:jgi/Botrbrau1/23537/Bobra.0141s0008.1
MAQCTVRFFSASKPVLLCDDKGRNFRIFVGRQHAGLSRGVGRSVHRIEALRKRGRCLVHATRGRSDVPQGEPLGGSDADEEAEQGGTPVEPLGVGPQKVSMAAAGNALLDPDPFVRWEASGKLSLNQLVQEIQKRKIPAGKRVKQNLRKRLMEVLDIEVRSGGFRNKPAAPEGDPQAPDPARGEGEEGGSLEPLQPVGVDSLSPAQRRQFLIERAVGYPKTITEITTDVLRKMMKEKGLFVPVYRQAMEVQSPPGQGPGSARC